MRPDNSRSSLIMLNADDDSDGNFSFSWLTRVSYSKISSSSLISICSRYLPITYPCCSIITHLSANSPLEHFLHFVLFRFFSNFRKHLMTDDFLLKIFHKWFEIVLTLNYISTTVTLMTVLTSFHVNDFSKHS